MPVFQQSVLGDGSLTEGSGRFSHYKHAVTNFVRTYYYNASQAWAANRGWYSSFGVFLGANNASPRRRILRVYINDFTVCQILWRYQKLGLASSRWCPVTGFCEQSNGSSRFLKAENFFIVWRHSAAQGTVMTHYLIFRDSAIGPICITLQ
jgi:hypothetical protein